jgi:hypothetical protein
MAGWRHAGGAQLSSVWFAADLGRGRCARPDRNGRARTFDARKFDMHLTIPTAHVMGYGPLAQRSGEAGLGTGVPRNLRG